MSPLRTEILAILLKILSDFPPSPNQNPGYAAGDQQRFMQKLPISA